MVKTRFHYLDRRDFFFQREFDVKTYENKTIPNSTGTYLPTTREYRKQR